jgi:hypothetical protein
MTTVLLEVNHLLFASLIHHLAVSGIKDERSLLQRTCYLLNGNRTFLQAISELLFTSVSKRVLVHHLS